MGSGAARFPSGRRLQPVRTSAGPRHASNNGRPPGRSSRVRGLHHRRVRRPIPQRGEFPDWRLSLDHRSGPHGRGRGDLLAAVKIMSVWLDPRIDASPLYRRDRAEMVPELVRLALAAGDAVTAVAAVATAAADAKVVPNVVVASVASVCRAMVEADPEPLVAAAECFDR